MKRIASFFLALALAFSLTACTVPVEKADDGKIQIVATLFPYYDFARAIVGDRADVTLLLSPGREAHSFEPTPLDAVTISESDVFLYNGGEGEYWVDSMLGAAGENIAVIARMMDFVDAREEEYVRGDAGRGRPRPRRMSMAATMTLTTMTASMKPMSTTATRSSTTSTSGRRRKTPSGLCRAVCRRALRGGSRQTPGSLPRELRWTTARSSKLSTRDLADALRVRTPCAICSIFADRFPLLYFCARIRPGLPRGVPRLLGRHRAERSPRIKYLIDKVEDEDIPVVYTIDLEHARRSRRR